MGILLGLLIAGGIAILYLPFSAREPSFLLGFIACTAFVSCILIPLVVMDRRAQPGPVPQIGTSLLLRLVLFFFLGLLIVLLFLWQNERGQLQRILQQKQTAQQLELIETTRNSGLLTWMSLLLDQVDEELSNNPHHMLSDEMIARLAALSYSFKPYARLEDDSVMTKALSPERGTLLLAITKMQLDSVTRRKIMMQSHFASAELKDADLRSANLNRADLQGADLRGANLEGALLDHANLNSANLWGANLRNARLEEADLKKAEMSWADLSGADLRRADLHEASFISAQLRGINLQETNLKWVDFTGAFLNDANLTGADMFRAMLRRSQLENADLNNANLNLANLSEANLTKANLAGADLSGVYISDAKWLVRLDEWLVPNANKIQQTYQVVEGIAHESLFQLKKMDE